MKYLCERESYIRYAKKNDLKPLAAAVEAIDYGEIALPEWLCGEKMLES